MPNRSPYGNLTASLVVVALLELIVNRLLGRLFMSPGCRTGLGCLLLQTGPFLLHLAGVLALVVGGGGIAGHLRRGELFPRGMRLTVAGLSVVCFFLVALSLAFGRMPERYHIHLETSFGFVVALLMLSFIGSHAASARTRAGFLLFALPTVLHVAALVSARAGWLRQSAISPERLTLVGELTLLLGAVAAPWLLVPRAVPRNRLLAAAALAAGVSAFFFVAFVGRTDLVQTIALYGVHMELPRPLSALGAFYLLALFGFVTTVGALLPSRGASRLAGMGMCLVAIAGYQTSSPVALAISLCGLVALATGILRATGDRVHQGQLSMTDWRALLAATAAGISGVSPATGDPVLIEVMAGSASTGEGQSDVATVRAPRRGRPVSLKLSRVAGVIRELEVVVGTPGQGAPDAIIESHEAWLARTSEDRGTLPRVKTGETGFDRRLGVHGAARISDRALRRRLLRLAEGTITLWGGRGARFVAPGVSPANPRRLALPAGPAVARSLTEVVDTLFDLVDHNVPPTPGADAA